MTLSSIKPILEAAIYIAGEPVSVERLLQLFEASPANATDAELRPPVTADMIRQALFQLQEDYQHHAIELVEVSSGYRFQVKVEVTPSLEKWLQEKPARYSRAFLETIALIAYKQPITRAEIEQVRGVAVSTQIIKSLLTREWVKIAGYRDVPGKPALYATTKQFLDYFSLKSLTELPPLIDSQEDKAVEQLMLVFEHKESQPVEEVSEENL